MERGNLNLRPFYYLSLSRIIAYLVYGFFHIYNGTQTLVLTIFLIFLLLVNYFQVSSFSKLDTAKKLGFYLLCLDVALIAVLSREVHNLNIFAIYLLMIACCSLILSAHKTIIISALVGVSFAYIRLYNSNELLSFYDMAASYFSFIGCALVCVYYSKLFEKLNSRILEKDKAIEQVNQDKQFLIESFSEGIITLDVNSAITGINQAAKAILGITKEFDSYTSNLKSIVDSSALINKKEILSLENGQSTQVQVFKNDKQVKVLCSLQEIKSEYGSSLGSVLFVTENLDQDSVDKETLDFKNIANLVKNFEIPARPANEKCAEIIGESQILRELLLVVEQAAPSDAPILILGESGTGKELISKSIHKLSKRADKPFVAINCGAIPENLLESELFGYKKGSFTSADRDHDGLFLQANNGTLFLDEVAELPLSLQVKLLRVLQEGVFRPIGANKEIKVDVRIIAATNKSLKELVFQNNFREDLYYRLRVIELVVPPLRSRKSDIPSLVYHFLDNLGVELSHLVIESEAWECLLRYDYPGNIRELENIIHRAKVLGSGLIKIEHFPEEVRNYKKAINQNLINLETGLSLPANLESILENIEVSYLLAALNQSKGIKKEAAKLLGLNFRSFRYRLKKYNLSDDEESELLESGRV